SYWKGLGLDFYCIHYYPWNDFGGPAGSGLPTYASLNLDKPCIVEEFPTADSSYGANDTNALSAKWYLDTIYNYGYAGALGWSYRAGDGASNWTSFQPVFTAWGHAHSSIVGPQALAAPAPPTNLSATAGDASVTLSWTGSATATSYNVYRWNGSSYAWLQNVGGTSCTDKGLTNGTTYWYEVTALNGAGESSASTPVSATPQVAAPAAPTNLTATGGNAVITLNWSASTGAATYNIYRGASTGGEGSVAIATGINSTAFVDYGATNGTTYFYKVSAVNAGGQSGKSNEASATPVASTVLFSDNFTNGAAPQWSFAPASGFWSVINGALQA